MTQKRDLKRRVRERQAKTGESYVTARRHVLAARPSDDADTNVGDANTNARDVSDDVPDNVEVAEEGVTASEAFAESLVEEARAVRVEGPPIVVDDVLDLTDAGPAAGLACRMLVYAKVAKLVDPVHAIAAVARAIAATPSDPAMELIRNVSRGQRSTEPTRRPLRDAAFMERVAAGFTGVSTDGRVLALHVDGKDGMVTILCAAWRQTATLLITTVDDTIAQVLSRLGTTATGEPLFLVYNGRRYPIGKEPFVIGRHKSCNLQIRDGFMSRKHAMVVRRREGYFIVDLGAHAGVEYRGLKIENKRIEEGDAYRLGEYVLRFTFQETDA